MLTQVWHWSSSLAGVECVFIGLEIAIIESFAVAKSSMRLVKSYCWHEYKIKNWKTLPTVHRILRDPDATKSIFPVVHRVFGQ